MNYSMNSGLDRIKLFFAILIWPDTNILCESYFDL
jgi:hypothetical protein